jgi:hypothetical protein
MSLWRLSIDHEEEKRRAALSPAGGAVQFSSH